MMKKFGYMMLGAASGGVLEGIKATSSGAIGSAMLKATGLNDIQISEVSHVVGVGGVITGAVLGAVDGLRFSYEDESTSKFFKTISNNDPRFFVARDLLNALVGFGVLKLLQDTLLPLGDDIASAAVGSAILSVPLVILAILFCNKNNQAEASNTHTYSRL